MDKAVEALNGAYRVLLAVCALLAILAVGATEDPLADTHALAALRDLRADHANLTLELAAHVKDYYRRQMLAVATPADRNFLTKSRFGDWYLDLYWDKTNAGRRIALDGGDVTVDDLLYLAGKPDRGVLRRYYFDDRASLATALGFLLDDSNEAFLAGKGFVKVRPAPDHAGFCQITAGPYRPADESDFARGRNARCREDTSETINDIANFAFGVRSVDLESSRSRLAAFAAIRAVRHANELQFLSSEEAKEASTDVEVLGLKVPKVLLLLGGPGLIALLLVQLWAQLQVAARADTAAAADGAGLGWFGLFSGPVQWFMLASVVVFPTATCLGLTLVHVLQQSRSGSEVGAGTSLLGAVETLVPLILALAVWLESRRLARTWGVRPAAA